MTTMPKTRLLLLLAVAFALALTGCSDSDDPVGPNGDVDAAKAAELVAGVQGPAAVGSVMTDVEMFRNPLTSLASDAGVLEEMSLDDGWSDEGVDTSYPAVSRLAADMAKSLGSSRREAVALAAAEEGPLKRLSLDKRFHTGKSAGDTVAVEYFDTPDSTGLNALIETDAVGVLRLVSIRDYPHAALLQIASRHSEIVFDSGDNLDPQDDVIHSLAHEFTRANGEHVVGELAPLSGPGPIEAGVTVRAFQRVEDPSFQILKEWITAEMILDPGVLDVDGDESIASMEIGVGWRSGAEQNVRVAPVEDDFIAPASDVRAVGRFTARPGNTWLETSNDTLMVRLGDLDDESDDLLLSAARAAVFDGTAVDGGHPRSWVRLTPDAPVAPGDEPCGGEAIEDVYYPATWWIVHLTRTADLECDGSGTLSVAMDFRDGTSATRTVTWDGQGGATLDETRQDGTVLSGSFDESTGAYTLDTTYPAGSDPVSRERHGTAVEGDVEAWETVTWQDGRDDRTYFHAIETAELSSVSGHRIDGAVREDFTLSEAANGDAAGEWSRNDGAEGEFQLEMLEGGGSHLTFAAADPEAPGSPSVSGEIFYAPDGSGTGTVTYTENGVTVTFPVTFGPDGEGVLEDGGDTFVI